MEIINFASMVEMQNVKWVYACNTKSPVKEG